MRIAQILQPDASHYERKSFRIDHAALAVAHEVIETTWEAVRSVGADLVHVYGPLRSKPRIDIPIVSDNSREAVAEEYFGARVSSPARASGFTIGTFRAGRPGVANMIEQTLARIHRFRDDVEWHVFDEPPTPDDLTLVDAWVDPATVDDDLDGFAAEALVAGKRVVASHTPMNGWRLDKGMSGFLVPPRDPNELTHAILTALFKSEVAEVKIEGARRTAGKFRPRQRVRALEKIYEAVTA